MNNKHSFLVTVIIASFVASVNGTIFFVHRKEKQLRMTSNDCDGKSNWIPLPNPVDCHKFYICINGKAENFICTNNLYFDAKEGRCKEAECPSNNLITKCESHSIRRRIENNCNAFSFCHNGIYVKRKCTSGYYFSTRDFSCQQISYSADHKCSCLLPPNAIISNPDDCETYYICTEGEAVLQRCSKGHYYNERVNSCLPNINGKCLKNHTTNSIEILDTQLIHNKEPSKQITYSLIVPLHSQKKSKYDKLSSKFINF